MIAKRLFPLFVLLAIAIAIPFPATTAWTESYQYETLGQPCRAKQILSGRTVVDRRDGRERFVIANNNEDYNLELIFIDFEKDTAEVYSAPTGAGSWALLEVPGDRLIVGTFYNGVFLVFDLKKMEFIKTIDFPGESYIWNLALGGDGRVYGGTYPGAKLGALDLDTYEVEDLGAPVLPNMYLRQVMPAPGGKVGAYFMTETNATRLFNPHTKQYEMLPGLQEGETVSNGVRYKQDYFLAITSSGRFCAWQGVEFKPLDTLPLPEPPEGGPWTGVNVLASDDDRLVLTHATGQYLVESADEKPVFLCNINTRGGAIYAVSRDRNLLGVRGQDYFVIHPGDRELKLRPIPAEGKGRPSMFLTADNRGRLWGGPHFGQTLYFYDINTGKTVNIGAISDSGGEVYECVVLNGVAYSAAYAGGEIIRYQPDEPWDQWNNVNPKTIASVRPGYIRPAAGIDIGPDGNLYAGWMAKYGTYGGALSRTNPDTGETKIWENPLGEQGLNGLHAGEKYVYLGTTRSANGLPNGTYSVRFGVWDYQDEKIIAELSFDDLGGISRMIEVPLLNVVCIGLGNEIGLFDLTTMKLNDTIPLDGNGIGTELLREGNSSLLFGMGKQLVRLNVETKQFETLIELPNALTHLARGSDGLLYATCSSDLIKIVAE